jgi:hypothetical protein
VLGTRRVGAFHLTQFALEAQLHDMVNIRCGQLRYIFVLAVDQVEHDRERVAVLKAHPAAVAQGKGPVNFFLKALLGPVFWIVG